MSRYKIGGKREVYEFTHSLLDTPTLWKVYLKNIYRPLFILTLPFLLLASGIYIAFLIFYGIFFGWMSMLMWLNKCSEDTVSDFIHVLIVIFEIPLYILTIFIISYVYAPAFLLSSILNPLCVPCQKVVQHNIKKVAQHNIKKEGKIKEVENIEVNNTIKKTKARAYTQMYRTGYCKRWRQLFCWR